MEDVKHAVEGCEGSPAADPTSDLPTHHAHNRSPAHTENLLQIAGSKSLLPEPPPTVILPPSVQLVPSPDQTDRAAAPQPPTSSCSAVIDQKSGPEQIKEQLASEAQKEESPQQQSGLVDQLQLSSADQSQLSSADQSQESLAEQSQLSSDNQSALISANQSKLSSADPSQLSYPGKEQLSSADGQRRLSDDDQSAADQPKPTSVGEHGALCEEPEICATKVIHCGWLDNTLPPPRVAAEPQAASTSASSSDVSEAIRSSDARLTATGQEGSNGPAEGCLDNPDGASQSVDDCGSTDKSIYRIKWISWNKCKCAIITQNENGPCPLLSIVNILLLRGKLTLPPGAEVVSAEQLLEYLGDLILSLSPDQNSQALDFQYNLNDAIAVLPKLQTGLDVNVKFTGVSDFEYTPECIIFDLLNISLYHGWLVDPQMAEIAVAVNSLSYNQLVERIITYKASDDSALVSQSLVGQQFLEESASQLTYHGLCELNARMRDGELAVFFRNNHFSTIYKQDEELFLLVTDQGFLRQEDVVWETLSNIEGDGHFVDHNFESSSGGKGGLVGGGGSGPPSEEQDRLLAESLQQEAALNTEGLSDEALAARLQEEENLAAQEMSRRAQQQQPVSAAPSSRSQQAQRSEGPANPIGPRTVKKDKNCTIC